MRSFRSLGVVVSLLLLVLGLSTAQTITGTVSGTVTDASGAVLSGAMLPCWLNGAPR